MNTHKAFRLASAGLIISATVIIACSQGAPSGPSASAPSVASAGDNGVVGASAVGDVKTGTGGIEIVRLRMDRQNAATGASVLRQYANPNQTYFFIAGEFIELWAEWDPSAVPRNPRLVVNWGDGGEADMTGCGSCRLVHKFPTTPGIFTVVVKLDDLSGTSVTRTFILNSTEPVPSPTPTPLSSPTPSPTPCVVPSPTLQGLQGFLVVNPCASPTPTPSPTPSPTPALLELFTNIQPSTGSGTVASTAGAFTINCPTHNAPGCTDSLTGTSASFTVMASPASGSVFTKWTGGACSNSTNPICSGTVTSATTPLTLVAHFSAAPASPTPTPSVSPTPTPVMRTISITVLQAGSGEGSVSDSTGTLQDCGNEFNGDSTSCSFQVVDGTTVSISADPKNGGPAGSRHFVAAWTGNCSGSSLGNSSDNGTKTCSLGSVTANKTLSVTFQK